MPLIHIPAQAMTKAFCLLAQTPAPAGRFHLNDATLKNCIWSVLILVGAWILSSVLKRAFHVLAPHFGLPPLGLRPMRLLIRYSVLVVALVLILKIWGLDMLNMLAAVFAMVAIGFVAVWSILSNFLCTLCLVLMKPFSIGDEVEFPGDGVSGTVVDLTLMFTLLRGAEGEFYQIPNNLFFQKILKRKVGAKSVELRHQLWQSEPAKADTAAVGK
jgi:small-conductance mechanosensitive channel